MILVLDTEINPDYRYLGPEIAYHTPAETEYRVFIDDPTIPNLDAYDGIILSGSTASVYDEEEHEEWLLPEFELIRQCIDDQIPLLGVCFGHQAVNVALGGEVVHDTRRATFVEMEQVADDETLDGVNGTVPVLHGDLVTELGAGMVTTASTSYNEHFCSRHEDAPLWTVQFHPEFTPRVTDEPSDWSPGDHDFDECNATRVFENFVRAVDSRT